MTVTTTTGPLWTQDQAIAYEAAQEAINGVIAGYSEQIARVTLLKPSPSPLKRRHSV